MLHTVVSYIHTTVRKVDVSRYRHINVIILSLPKIQRWHRGARWTRVRTAVHTYQPTDTHVPNMAHLARTGTQTRVR